MWVILLCVIYPTEEYISWCSIN